MPAVAVIGAVAGVASSVIGANAAKKASDAQVSSAKSQIDFDKAIYQDQKLLFGPYRESGAINQQILDYEMGIGPKPMLGVVNAPSIEEVKVKKKPTTYKVGDKIFATRDLASTYANSQASAGVEYGGFKATPGYDFRVKSANDALTNSVATRGSLFSGQTLKDLSALNQNLATDEYSNYLARVQGAVNRGQAAAGGTADAAGNLGNNVGISNTNIANAYSQGAIARGQAMQSGIGSVATGFSSMFAPKPIPPSGGLY